MGLYPTTDRGGDPAEEEEPGKGPIHSGQEPINEE